MYITVIMAYTYMYTVTISLALRQYRQYRKLKSVDSSVRKLEQIGMCYREMKRVSQHQWAHA